MPDAALPEHGSRTPGAGRRSALHPPLTVRDLRCCKSHLICDLYSDAPSTNAVDIAQDMGKDQENDIPHTRGLEGLARLRLRHALTAALTGPNA